MERWRHQNIWMNPPRRWHSSWYKDGRSYFYFTQNTHMKQTEACVWLLVRVRSPPPRLLRGAPGREGKCQVTETPRRKYTKLRQSGTRGYVTRTVSLLLTPVTCEELAVVRVTHSLNKFFGQTFPWLQVLFWSRQLFRFLFLSGSPSSWQKIFYSGQPFLAHTFIDPLSANISYSSCIL